MVKESDLMTASGYIGGYGNAKRIVTYGEPFILKNSSPRFIKFNWLGF